MVWKWLYCILMEWAGVVISVQALEGKKKRFDIRKAFVYLIIYLVYYIGMTRLGLPDLISVFSYVILFAYIRWSYREELVKSFALMVFSLILVSMSELVSYQITALFYSVQFETGKFELMASTILIVLCIILSRGKLDRVLIMIERWEAAYILVALLSLMIFTPVVTLRILEKLDVSDYMYIVMCIAVMWMLVSKIQKNNMENRMRKKYLEGFTEVILQIRRRQHKVKNQFNTAFGMYYLYDTYEELVQKQKEYLGRLWEYELPAEAVVLEEPAVVALIYEKINEAIEAGITVETSFTCSMVGGSVPDVIWVEVLGTLLDNAIEALKQYGGTKKLWITIKRNNEEQDRVEIEIVNTFRHLKQMELEQFFEPGYSTKGEDRGIGLYDVKELVYKNEGELRVESGEKEGDACFLIWIVM